MNIAIKLACSGLLAATALLAFSSVPNLSSAWAHCGDWRGGYWGNPGYQRSYYHNNGGLLSNLFGDNYDRSQYYRPQPRWAAYRHYGYGPSPAAYYRHAWHEHHHHRHEWRRDWDHDGDWD